MMTAVSDDLVTVAEASKILGRSIEQVRRYLREGKLPGKRIGGQWFVERDVLVAHKREARYQEQMKLLEEIRTNREAIYKSTGLLFDGAELVHQIREEREAELEHRLP